MSVDFTKSRRAMDRRQHEQTYSNFLKLLIATTVLSIVVLAGMAVFLT